MVFRRVWKVAIFSIAMSGCAVAPDVIRIEGVTPLAEAGFTLADARSMENLSGGMSETSYAVWRVYGDDQILPPPLALLRSNIARALSQQLAGKVLKVEKFEVSVTRYKAGSQGSQIPVPSSGSVGADILGGLIGGMLIAAIESAKNDPLITTEIVVDLEGRKAEYSERETAPFSSLDKRLAENMVKAVAGVTVKIGELIKPRAEAPAVESGGSK